jgi:hypothetical protein
MNDEKKRGKGFFVIAPARNFAPSRAEGEAVLNSNSFYVFRVRRKTKIA